MQSASLHHWENGETKLPLIHTGMHHIPESILRLDCSELRQMRRLIYFLIAEMPVFVH